MLVLISNILGIFSLLALFLATKFPSVLFNYFVLGLGIILFLQTIYLLIIFLKNKELRIKKYEGFQLFARLLIPILIFYYFFTYN